MRLEPAAKKSVTGCELTPVDCSGNVVR